MRLSEQYTLLNLAVFYHLLNNITSLITVSQTLESKFIYMAPHRPIYKTPSSAMSYRPALYPNNQWFMILTVLLFL